VNRRPSIPAGRARLLGRTAALAAAVLLALMTLPITMAGAAPAATARSTRATPAVRMSVVSVTPTSPVPSQTPKALTIVLSVTNLSAKSLSRLTIGAVRGDPIEDQHALDKSLARSSWPTRWVDVLAKHPVRINLAAHATATVIFPTDTDVPEDAGVCICHQAVYPLFFGAFRNSDNARLGFTHTYLPVFSSKPAPVRVAWVWPLIDHPHRSTSESLFTDDDLTDLVSSGGRLGKSLAVLERVGGQGVPITVLIDPELLDELVVMSTGKYTVRTAPSQPRVAGIGAAAATAWLDQLRALLTNDPNVQVRLTPYADPDVQTLAQRHLTWAPQLAGPLMTSHVQSALAGRPLSFDTAWPASGAIGQDALDLMRAKGVRTLLLDDAGVNQAQDSSVPAGLARLRSGGTTIAAGLLSHTMQNYAEAVLTNRGGTGLSQLPNLAAELAVQAAQEPDTEHEVVLAAPRYVDPDPATAYYAIMDTTHAPYIAASSLTTVTAKASLPTTTARLAKIPANARQLSEAIIEEANDATAALPTLNSLLGGDAQARAGLLAGLPLAVQRSVSSAWRIQRAKGTTRADELSTTFTTLLGGVHIVQPTSRNGSYTLGSSNSTLPITVQNDLAYAVRVQVIVQTVNNVPGFDTPGGAATIEPRTKRTLHLPTEVSRTGRIPVVAQLYTPESEPVGGSVSLTVHSTVLGVVGVVITVAAGAVLVIALVFRFARRMRKREPAPAPAPVPVDGDSVGTGPSR
jgi:hypothetical protein